MYSEYKSTIMSWLTVIPSHWNEIRGKNLYTKQNRPVRQQDDIVTCFRDGIVTLRKKRRITGFTESIQWSGYQGVRKGDLVIHVMDAFAGSIGVSDSDGKSTPVYNVCTAKLDLNSFYYAYALREMARTGYIQSLYRGIRQRSSDFRFDVFAMQILPLPPREEQDKIVRYLDWKVSRINKLINAKRRQIELLREYEQAIINHVVTKGLEPGASMKDGGVAWVAKVPTHWSAIRLKYVLTRIVDCPHETPAYDYDGEYFVIRTADQELCTLRGNEQMFRLNETEYRSRIRREPLLKNDIVYGREGERWGFACLVPEDDVYCLGQRVMQFRCDNSKVCSKFIMYALNSEYVYRQGVLDTLGSTSPHVNISTIRNYFLVMPPMREQQIISDYLDNKHDIISTAIKKAQSIINELRTYQTRLISDVVTGKVDVRDVVVPEYETIEETADSDQTGDEDIAEMGDE